MDLPTPVGTGSGGTEGSAGQREVVTVDELPLAVVAVDRAGRIQRWSQGAVKLLGFVEEEVLGVIGWDLLVRDGDREQATRLGSLLAEGDLDVAWQVRTRSGTSRVLRLRVMGRRDSQGQVIGQLLLGRDAQLDDDAASTALARLTVLGRAGERLAQALDVESTMSAIADIAVPALADHCIIDLVAETGGLIRAAVAHADTVRPSEDPWAAVGDQVSYPAEHPVSICLEQRRAVLISGGSADDLERLAPTPASAAFARKVGVRSAVAVPLVARGRTLGVLSLVLSASGRHYEAGDVELSSELARRAGLAVANARLFEQQRATALELQRSLLPGRLPAAEGLHLTWRYAPAGLTSVGGDWIDALPLSAGRTLLVIGDVQGRGTRAAAVMGQLRTAVRVFATLDLDLADLLDRLDNLVGDLDDGLLATCGLATFDPFSRLLSYASAGHPPLMVGPRHQLTPVTTPADPPLGVTGQPHTQYDRVLAPGEQVVLYTDGLVERHGHDVDAGLLVLRETLSRAGDDAEAADAAIALIGPTAQDDAALLIATSSPEDLPSVTAVLDHHQPARQARALIKQMAAALDCIPSLELAQLLISELVTNSVRHTRGGRPPVLRLRRGREHLWIEVEDRDLRLPRLRRSDSDDEGGRGLVLVDALSQRWGTRPLADGKTVWAQLPSARLERRPRFATAAAGAT